MPKQDHPTPLLEVVVDHLDPEPGLTALCAGYEGGGWRCDQLAAHLMQWLPEFALKYSELANFGPHNALELTVKAARSVYASQKYKLRGEFGEILLHVALRQRFKTLPAISKYFYKDSRNDTVKGFDAVHVVASRNSLELWLGEVKFYSDVFSAITHVVDELKVHTQRNYLRDEFTAITNKIDDAWPHSERLKKLLHPNTSLDQVFDRACIPVLLTYDSPVVAEFSEVSSAYKAAFEREVREHHKSFASKSLPGNVRIHLFLVPLLKKSALVAALDEKLKNLQGAQ